MGRNLIICLDGTNNQYAATNTNVVKLYAMLDRTGINQIAYYQTGIGTFAPPGMWGKVQRWIVTRLDLAVAWLLQEHVMSAYRFLMDYYQEGDQIYIFGFSRGAYTARVLAGMLYKVGLLGQGNEELVPLAWDMFKREPSRDASEEAKGFRYTFGRKVPIKFLGLWDTVSSVGWVWHPKYFQYTAYNPMVQMVRHAVALDERRTYFVQNLWTSYPPPGQDAVEAWFPGVHCDVGGGYREPEAGLSKIALQWMVREAGHAGLQLNPTAESVIIPTQGTPRHAKPNPLAKIHESLRGFWWVVEVLPKRIKDPANQFTPRWIWPLGRSRTVNEGASIHASVIERKEKMDYRPTNVPNKYHVIE